VVSAIASRRSALIGVVLIGVGIAVIGLGPGGPESERRAAPAANSVDPAPEATPELADRAVSRLRLFRTGGAGPRLSLSADEVTALIRHAMPGVLPVGVADPVVRLEAGVLAIEARLATEDFAGRAHLASVLGALPDNIDVRLRGGLDGYGDRLAFTVEQASAAGVPLPARSVAAIVAAVAERSEYQALSRGERGASLSVRWPEGVASAVVVEGRLVLGHDERMTDRAVDGSDDS